jgi:2-desacetyl-2-hydroxyethyl bacteriochlorophyllide A dehydrogenase
MGRTVNATDMKTREVRALWYTAPGKAELRQTALPAPGSDQVLVKSLFSGLSRGTERLVFEGKVPGSEYARMRLPTQEGEFSFPVKYGYAAVGTVEEGPAALKGKTVFALHPHQERFVIPVSAAVVVPDRVPARRAVLSANLETALNILWDGHAAPADRIVIIGGGLVGLLTAALAAGLPGAEVTVVDKDKSRADLAKKIGVVFATPENAPHDADLVVNASASEAGLCLGIELAGTEANVVEASWHGDKPVNLSLGGNFHSRRLRIISSQVGTLPAERRARWTPRRRMEAVMRLLADDRYEALLGEEVAFADLPRELPRLLAPDAAGVGALVRY